MLEDITNELRDLKSSDQYREIMSIDSANGKYVLIEGKEYLNLVSNNYLGLANHQEIKKAAIQGLEKWGTGSGGARLLSGSQSPHLELEKKLCDIHGMESTLLFNSGYSANLGVVQVLSEFADKIYSDKLNHASIMEGLRSNRKSFHRYPHNDLNKLEDDLKEEENPKKILVISETLFSMEGDFVDFERLSDLQKKYEFFLFLDEAHSFGGYPEVNQQLSNFNPNRILVMGTFGKALGGFGAFVTGPSEIIDLLINKCRPFIFSTALPAFQCLQIMKSLEIVNKDSERSEKLKKVNQFFGRALEQNKVPHDQVLSHIVPIVIGSNSLTLAIANNLREEGLLVMAVRFPTVPKGTARLRISLNCELNESELSNIANKIKYCLDKQLIGATA